MSQSVTSLLASIQNFASGGTVSAVSHSGVPTVNEAGTITIPESLAAKLAAGDTFTVWAAGQTPEEGNAELVYVESKAAPSGGKVVVTVKRRWSGEANNPGRAIVAGDNVACGLTQHTWEEVQRLLGANIGETGQVFVMVNGSDTNSGSRPTDAVRSAKKANELLPLASTEPEGEATYGSTGIACRIGEVVFGVGVFVGTGYESSVHEYTCSNKEKGGKTILCPGKTVKELEELVGTFTFCMDEWKNFPELAIVKEVKGTEELVLIEGYSWGVKTVGEGGSTHTIAFITPAFMALPGVKYIGKGKHSGTGLAGSKNFGTKIQDNGKGVTVICPAGSGEKAESLVGLELRGLTINGKGKKTTAPETTQAGAKSGLQREGGETISGFMCANIAEVFMYDCQFSEHGVVGCFIGQKAVVTYNAFNCMFTLNGVYENVWHEAGNTFYGGLWLAKAPNQGALMNNRYTKNFGFGLNCEGGMNTFNDEHSHNFKLKNEPGTKYDGTGLLTAGGPAEGNFSLFGGWGEGNDRYEMSFTGSIVTALSGYQFKGATAANTAGKSCPTGISLGGGQCVFENCEWIALGYWGKEAFEQVYLMEFQSNTILEMSGCKGLLGGKTKTEEEESNLKGIKKGGSLKADVSRTEMTSFAFPAMRVSRPESFKLEAAAVSGTAVQNTSGNNAMAVAGVELEAEGEAEILVGPTSAECTNRIGPVYKGGVSTITMTAPVPAGYWVKVVTVKKVKGYIGSGGAGKLDFALLG